MIIKTVIIAFIVVILGSLGSGLVYLLKDHGQSDRVVKALTVRITLSLGLFALLLIAFATGWITPHAI